MSCVGASGLGAGGGAGNYYYRIAVSAPVMSTIFTRMMKRQGIKGCGGGAAASASSGVAVVLLAVGVGYLFITVVVVALLGPATFSHTSAHVVGWSVLVIANHHHQLRLAVVVVVGNLNTNIFQRTG